MLTCPICQKPDASAGHILAHSSRLDPSPLQIKASRRNGKKGGRPISKPVRISTEKKVVA